MPEVTVALPDGAVATYLDRLGLPRTVAPMPEALRTLHLAHLEQIPFENLSVALGEPVDLDPQALATKVLGRGRGGFCYELNGLFAHLLTAPRARGASLATCSAQARGLRPLRSGPWFTSHDQPT
jgi:N-hydroxyarylamine O-acetyltransferase